MSNILQTGETKLTFIYSLSDPNTNEIKDMWANQIIQI